MDSEGTPAFQARPPRSHDPEPIAIVTLCVGAPTMAGSIANAYVNHRKYIRDREVREEDAAAQFLAESDALRAAGERLLGITRMVGDHGVAAFRMTDLLPRSPETASSRPLSLRAGDTSLDLTAEEVERWDALVEAATRGAESMNKAVAAYEQAFADLLASGRSLEQVLGTSLDSVIRNVVNHSISFRKALDSYQNLRAGSTIAEAEQRFNRLRIATAAMVEAANGFTSVTAMLLRSRRAR